MKLEREPVQLPSDSSFTVFRHDTTSPCPMFWHYHPEYELLYLPMGSGRRHIGHNISRYESGELLLLGPNVPHLSYGYGQAPPFEEIVVQFRHDLVGADLLARPEMAQLRALLARCRTGLVFGPAVRQAIGPHIKHLLAQPPWERLLALLNILQQLALTADYTDLAAGPPVAAATTGGQDRLNRVLTLLDQRLTGPVSVPELAAEAALSVPAFCRFFKKMTQRTVTEFVNECRVQRACHLLAHSASITEVGYASGFQNLSYFNRTFRRLVGVSPSAYRRTADVARAL